MSADRLALFGQDYVGKLLRTVWTDRLARYRLAIYRLVALSKFVTLDRHTNSLSVNISKWLIRGLKHADFFLDVYDELDH